MFRGIFLFFCLFIGSSALAQSDWLKPVVFPKGATLCDFDDWQLVFFDDFEGEQLSPLWHTYLVWNGMGVENSNWDGARDSYANALNKDENVFVSDGTCKILMKNETYSWKCDTCREADRRTRNLTAGALSTYFRKGGKPNYFNSGKFESKIKFPTTEGIWSAFWLWHGTQINEIDIAEAYGARLNQFPINTYNLHAWRPRKRNQHLAYNAAVENRYPMQSWYHRVNGQYFNQAEWHIYTCIWDRTNISFWVDNQWVNTIWKYYRYKTLTVKVGNGTKTYRYKIYSSCDPESGAWSITYGYPYFNDAQCNLRLNTSMIPEYEGIADTVFEIGRMEIDYVKVWQRQPSLDGHRNILNAVSEPKIYGPENFKNQAIFIATPAAKGFWQLEDNLSIKIDSTWMRNDSAFVRLNRSLIENGNPTEKLNYRYSDGRSHSLQQVSFILKNSNSIDMPDNFVVAVKQANQLYYSLFVAEDESLNDFKLNYEWKINYTSDSRKEIYQFTRNGKFVSVPGELLRAGERFQLTWQLTMKDANGIEINKWNGAINTESLTGQQNQNENIYFYRADIPKKSSYERRVSERVAQLFMASDASTMEVESVIEKIRIEELEPYILFEK